MNLLRRMLTGSHDSTQDHMSAHLDGELRGVSRWRFARHLAWCRGCQAVLDSLQATVAGLRSIGTDDDGMEPDADVADAVRGRIAAGSDQREP
ncbi:MAG: anti-sigma factor family protein [Gaiellales bacterium]